MFCMPRTAVVSAVPSTHTADSRADKHAEKSIAQASAVAIMRPRTLRETVALARGQNDWGDGARGSRIVEDAAWRQPVRHDLCNLPFVKKTNLGTDAFLSCPRDVIMHIICWLSRVDIANLLAVCHAFGRVEGEGYASSVTADALLLRARAGGSNPPASLSAAALLREEALRDLSSSLVCESSGLPLLLSVYTNTGYRGVTFRAWAKPWSYRAEADDGTALGSFPSAVKAAEAYARQWTFCGQSERR